MAWLFERAVLVGALLFFMEAVVLVVLNPNDVFLDEQTLDPVHMAMNIVVVIAGMALAFPLRRRIVQSLTENPVLCAFLLLVVLSSIWSPVPMFTLRRTLTLLITTIFGLYVGLRYDQKEQIRIILITCAIAMLLSTVFVLALPHYGREAGGAWRGVFIQKNIFGRYMVLTLALMLNFRARGLRKVIMKTLGLILVLGLLAGSQSVGAYIVAAISLPLLFASRLLGVQRKRLIPILMCVVPLLAMAIACLWIGRAELLASMGRNASLTQRVPLWNALLEKVVERPLLGFGYEGFWSTQSSEIWSQLVKWTPLKAHNGYLDLCLDLGTVGLALFAINTLIVMRRSLKLALARGSLRVSWPLLLLSLILLYNFFETDLVGGFLWLVYVTITVSSQQALKAVQAEDNPPSLVFASMSDTYQYAP